MTLVLLHSAGADASLWDRVRTHLTGVPVFAPDLPGRRGAAWSVEETGRDVAAYARWVLSAMDAASIPAATIAGHSLGGAIALYLALEHPERVRGLGLSCSGARLRVRPEVLDALADGVSDAADAFANAHAGPATSDRDRVALRRMLQSTGPEQLLADLLACDRFDAMDRVHELRVRTQILGGEQDVLTPLRYQRYLADRIPGARLTVYPTGHALPLERPEEVAGELAVLWAATADRTRRAATAGRGGVTTASSAGETSGRPGC